MAAVGDLQQALLLGVDVEQLTQQVGNAADTGQARQRPVSDATILVSCRPHGAEEPRVG